MNVVSRVRGLLSRSTLRSFLLNGLTRVRVMALLSRRHGLNMLLQCNVECRSLGLCMLIICLGFLRDLSILQVMEMVMGNERDARLVRSPNGRALEVRVNGSGQACRVLRAFLFAVLFRDVRRDLQGLAIIGRIGPSRSSKFLSPLVIYLVISSDDGTAYRFSVLVNGVVLYLTRLRHDILVLTRNVRFITRGVERVMFITFMRIMIRISRHLRVLLTFSLFGFGW